MYLLDTNILIYFLGNNNLKAAGYVIHENSYISVLTRMELLAGVKNKKDKSAIINLLEPLNTININNDIADIAADILSRLKRSERKYPDTLIAATALFHNLNLVTANIKDFNKIPNLKIIGFKLE